MSCIERPNSQFFKVTKLFGLWVTCSRIQQKVTTKRKVRSPVVLTCICLSSRLFRVTFKISRAECNIDVTPGTLTVTDTCIGYHVTRFEASRKVTLHTRYVCACVGAGGESGRETKIKTNVILHTRYVSTYVGAGGGRGREQKK
jgi:hypothetical protein